MIAAVIPVYGRLPLVKLTVKRLLEKNRVDEVICVGHEPEAREAVTGQGAQWIEHPNNPLGAKWNAGFMAIEKYNPEAALYLGSSDWIEDNYVDLIRDLTSLGGFGLAGKSGCTFVDIGKELRAMFWSGYGMFDPRHKESIGIGRILSNKLLKALKWRPFDDFLDSSLDFSMWTRTLSLARLGYLGEKDIIVVKNKFADLLSISCDKWENKHKFDSIKKEQEGLIHRQDIDAIVAKFPELAQI